MASSNVEMHFRCVRRLIFDFAGFNLVPTTPFLAILVNRGRWVDVNRNYLGLPIFWKATLNAAFEKIQDCLHHQSHMSNFSEIFKQDEPGGPKINP